MIERLPDYHDLHREHERSLPPTPDFPERFTNDDLQRTIELLIEDLQAFEVSDELTPEENLEELKTMIRAWL